MGKIQNCKGGSSQIREKDIKDFQAVLSSLSSKEKEWLKEGLKRQFSFFIDLLLKKKMQD